MKSFVSRLVVALMATVLFSSSVQAQGGIEIKSATVWEIWPGNDRIIVDTAYNAQWHWNGEIPCGTVKYEVWATVEENGQQVNRWVELGRKDFDGQHKLDNQIFVFDACNEFFWDHDGFPWLPQKKNVYTVKATLIKNQGGIWTDVASDQKNTTRIAPPAGGGGGGVGN